MTRTIYEVTLRRKRIHKSTSERKAAKILQHNPGSLLIVRSGGLVMAAIRNPL